MLGLAHRGFALADKSHHLAAFLKSHDYETVLCGLQHEAAHHEWDQLGYGRLLEPEKLDLPKPQTWEESGEQHVKRDASLIDAAVDYLGEEHEKPFFLSIGLFSPHRHFPAPGPDDNPDRMQPPPTLPDSPETRYDMASFATMVRSVDHGLGQILDTLEKQGLTDDTLIICTTDHGPAFPGMKCSLRDFGIGVALILSGPGTEKVRGKATDALTSQIDLFPTICELTGLPRPDWLQGESLMPLLQGEAGEIRDEIFAEVTYHAAFEPTRCIRTRRYKFIKRFDEFELLVKPNIDDGPSKQFLLKEAALADCPAEPLEALYDLYYDPSEKENLIDLPSHRDIAIEFRGRLEAWMKQTGDPLFTDPRPKVPGAKVNRQDGLHVSDAELEED